MPIWVRWLDALFSALSLIVLSPRAVLRNACYYNDLRSRCDRWDLVKRRYVLAQLENPRQP